MKVNGATLRAIREEQGWGLNDFARTIGIDPAHLSRIERGKRGGRGPSPWIVKVIADGLSVPTSTIADMPEELAS